LNQTRNNQMRLLVLSDIVSGYSSFGSKGLWGINWLYPYIFRYSFSFF